MATNRLITLAFSHYNEKARWALDVTGVDYTEERWMPGFSQLAVLVATRGKGGRRDDVSSRFSTPVMRTADGEMLVDSTDIARWASARLPGDPLFPRAHAAEVTELVERFGRRLGPQTRLAAYQFVLPQKKVMRSLADGNVGPIQTLAFRAVAPVGATLIRKGLRVTPERAARAVERVREELAFVGDRLANRAYLVGDAFTAADLTFAALLAPVLLVTREEGYGATFPRLADLPPEAADLVGEVRASVGGSFALEMFRRHRRSLASA